MALGPLLRGKQRFRNCIFIIQKCLCFLKSNIQYGPLCPFSCCWEHVDSGSESKVSGWAQAEVMAMLVIHGVTFMVLRGWTLQTPHPLSNYRFSHCVAAGAVLRDGAIVSDTLLRICSWFCSPSIYIFIVLPLSAPLIMLMSILDYEQSATHG